MRLIDADALYERACELEAQALAYVGKIINDETKVEEWKIWSAILAERTAFKHDVFDAPTIEPEPHWIKCSERLPEYGVSVLTYDGHCFCVEKRIPNIRDEEGEPITGDWWVSDDYDEYDSDYYPNLRDGACIAWMPLPEAFMEDEG